MPWIQLIVTTDRKQHEQAEQALMDAGALSVTYQDAEDNPVLEPAPGETPLWDKLILTGLFDAHHNSEGLKQQLQKRLGDTISIKAELLEDKDWIRAWMDDYKPMQFGAHLWVCPKHLTPPDPNAVNLMLDPGLAFGTGTHPTTALCLQWLDSADVKDKTVLDYGCGSGVLAIAALLLGANHCDGVDIDPQALDASRDNADSNQVSAKLSVMLPQQLPQQQYDIVIANILAGPLVQLAPTLCAHLKPGGRIVLSGILQTQANEILQAYAPWCTLDPVVTREDWIRVSGIRQA
ncbi:MAG: 50S ribosomal protein L11 methyltransferase [Gammaproteobacteria bacterium]|nr:MAG: 50S ribosomal protein L11 methyltransferase [Gammaproteobacteria bacterium]